MKNKTDQCAKCAMGCPSEIVQAKLNKGRIPFDRCMDFTPKQTNFDHIHSMSIEELAKFILSGEVAAICPLCLYSHTENCRYDEEGEEVGTAEICKKGVLYWLQSEVEG